MKWRKIALAAAVFLVVLELTLQLGALVVAWATPARRLPPGSGANVLCVGDSFTYGIGASSPSTSYTGALQSQLRARGHDVTVQNGGRPGKDSAVVLRHLEQDLTSDIEVLCVLVGTNDTWSHPEPVGDDVARPPEGFRLRWRTGQLLALLTGFAKGSWQQAGPDVATSPTPPVATADPAAREPLAAPAIGYAMLERAGVLPTSPRPLLLPPACPEPPGADVNRTLQLVASGQHHEAQPLADRIAAEHADCAHAWMAVAAAANANVDQQRADTALEHLRRLADDGNDAHGSFALMTALGATRRAQELFEFARKRVAAEPRDIVAWKAYQHGAFILGHHDEFLRAAPAALAIGGRLDPAESATVLRHYGRVVCPRDPGLAARLIVSALLLDGEFGKARATVRALLGGATRADFEAVVAEQGVPAATRTAILSLFEGRRDEVEESWAAVLRHHLERMATLARSRGVEMVIVSYPFFNERLERTQREAAQSLGVPFVCVRERFDEEKKTRAHEELFVPDGHCNDAGYAIIAELVADAVAPLLKR